MKKITALSFSLCLALAATGCVEKSNDLTSAERDELTQFVSTTPTTPAHPLDIDFEGKIKLIGYDLEPAEIKAGEPFTVTWHWKVVRPLEEGWTIFTHVANAAGQNVLNQDGVGFIREHYAPGRWKRGEFIRDAQQVTLPADWASPTVTFYLGMWNGPNRLQVTSGPSDGDNRARALQIDVTPVPAAAPPPPPRPTVPPVPTLRVLKATTPIRIDGRLDEPAWQSAAHTPTLVDTMTGAPAEFAATARMTWDDQNVYLGWEVADDYLKSTFTQHDDHLWEQDCVEVMFDPLGDQRNYFEIQVAPTGVSFETRYDTRRQPQPFGDVAWTSQVRAQVVRTGTMNDDQPDTGYTVEMSIPWAAFAVGDPPAVKPTNNTVWGMNLFVLDARETGGRAAGWSPPRVGDFHAIDRFGRVIFADPTAPAAVPPPAPVAPGPPSGATGAAAPLQVNPALAAQLRARLGANAQPANLPPNGPARP
jgi:hypothetical protein